MTLAQKITEARKKRGLTQAELAKQADVQQGTVSRIEKGETTPNRNTIVSLCNALDLLPSELGLQVEGEYMVSKSTIVIREYSNPFGSPESFGIQIFHPLFTRSESNQSIQYCPYSGNKLTDSCNTCGDPLFVRKGTIARFCPTCGSTYELVPTKEAFLSGDITIIWDSTQNRILYEPDGKDKSVVEILDINDSNRKQILKDIERLLDLECTDYTLPRRYE